MLYSALTNNVVCFQGSFLMVSGFSRELLEWLPAVFRYEAGDNKFVELKPELDQVRTNHAAVLVSDRLREKCPE